MSWVQTYSGKAVDLFDTKPEQIDFNDIAHALSLLCRFTGHTREHYSVAQHCVLVSKLLPEEIQIYGLLHDAHEAYLGDINTVVKRVINRSILSEVAENLDQAIYAAAEVRAPSAVTKAAVKAADLQLLMTERRDLMSKPPRDWGDFESIIPVDDIVEPWRATLAETLFKAELQGCYYRMGRRHTLIPREI